MFWQMNDFYANTFPFLLKNTVAKTGERAKDSLSVFIGVIWRHTANNSDMDDIELNYGIHSFHLPEIYEIIHYEH